MTTERLSRANAGGLTNFVAWLLLIAAFLSYASAFASELRVLLAIPCVIFGYFVSTVIHETGHVSANLFCGWRVVTVVAKPIGLQVPNRNLAIVRRGFEPGAGGWVASYPPTAADNSRARWMIVVAAGPLFSLVTAGLCFWGFSSFLAPADGNSLLVSHLALGFGFQALHGGVVSLLPPVEGPSSDGNLLRMFMAQKQGVGGLQITVALLNNKVRLRDLPEWALDAARSDAARLDPDVDGKATRYVETLHVGRALDRGRVDAVRARQLIDNFRERYGGDEWLDACDAYLSAVWEADGARAQTLLPQGECKSEMRPLRHAAEAAVAARFGNEASAQEHLKEMAAALRAQSPFRDMTYVDIRHQIEALLQGGAPIQPSARSSAGPPARMKRLSQ